MGYGWRGMADLIGRREFLPVDVMVLAELADGHRLLALLVEFLLDAGYNGLRLSSIFSGDAHDILGHRVLRFVAFAFDEREDKFSRDECLLAEEGALTFPLFRSTDASSVLEEWAIRRCSSFCSAGVNSRYLPMGSLPSWTFMMRTRFSLVTS